MRAEYQHAPSAPATSSSVVSFISKSDGGTAIGACATQPVSLLNGTATCTTAPAIQINGEFYENLDVPKTESIIDELRRQG